MTLDHFRDFCLNFKGTTEDLPFDENTLVFKVMGEMFALTNLFNFEFINLKCSPEKATVLREEFMEVSPAYHMNKKHWNSIRVDGDLSDIQLKQWITDSYNLVVKNMSKKLRELL